MSNSSKEYQAAYYEANKETIRAKSRKWYQENKERANERGKWRYDNDYVAIILDRCRQRARDKGVEFSLKREHIVIPERCPVLDIPLERNKGKGAAPNSPSVDRIIPSLGYVPGNIQVISYKANRMKADASPEELMRFAEWVFRSQDSELKKAA